MNGSGALDLEQAVVITGSVIVMMSAVIAACLAHVASRSGHGTRGFARSLIVALAIIAVGAAVTTVQLGLGHANKVPSIALALMGAAIVVTASLTRNPDLGTLHQRIRSMFDAGIAGLSLFVVIWLTLGRTAHVHGGDYVAVTALMIASVLYFAIARTGAAITLRREPQSPAESGSALALLAFVLLALGSAVLIVRFTGFASVGATAAGYFLVISALAVFAGAAMSMLNSTLPRVRLHRQSLKAWLDLSPVVLAFSAFAVAIIDTFVHQHLDTTGVIVATAVIAAVLVRQTVMLADNRALAASLRRSVGGLEYQATHDSLTDLPNRAGLHHRVDAARRAAAHRQKLCAVYFVDLDHLKAVNDSLGHAAGDILLRSVANRLRSRIGSGVSRFGGDEFVVVVDDLASIADAERLGRMIVADMEEPLSIDGQRVGGSASVGLAFAHGNEDTDEVLRQADVALYRAKARGRRCLVTYSADDDPALRTGLATRNDLLAAIDRGEFMLHYQPVVRLDTGAVARFEALLRWVHPERGTLVPAHFLDAAADAGLLGTIGEASLVQACTDFASLSSSIDDEGRIVPPPGVAVNLSSSELVDRRAVARVDDALRRSMLEPRRLTIEITEDVIVDQAIRDTIDSIRGLGAHLAIDDFGTGWSSLRQLGIYPAEVLKIDKAFVDHISSDADARSVLATVVQLANELGLTTVAEGVETTEQCQLLASMGCDMAQGWLFAKAMPFDEAVEWMRSRADDPLTGSAVAAGSASAQA